MGRSVRFLIEGHEYPLAERTAVLLSQNLIAYDPDGDWEGSQRRALARSIERSLVEPDAPPIKLRSSAELSTLEQTLDYMVAGGDREIAVLQRAARRALGKGESPILDAIIGDSGQGPNGH